MIANDYMRKKCNVIRNDMMITALVSRTQMLEAFGGIHKNDF